ncbi:hypothetical protein N7488_003821 [Penicillium malachiteum]|nr:hypothetical protein N7488_003821 [Penicillium malachiteum]
MRITVEIAAQRVLESNLHVVLEDALIYTLIQITAELASQFHVSALLQDVVLGDVPISTLTPLTVARATQRVRLQPQHAAPEIAPTQHQISTTAAPVSRCHVSLAVTEHAPIYYQAPHTVETAFRLHVLGPGQAAALQHHVQVNYQPVAMGLVLTSYQALHTVEIAFRPHALEPNQAVVPVVLLDQEEVLVSTVCVSAVQPQHRSAQQQESAVPLERLAYQADRFLAAVSASTHALQHLIQVEQRYVALCHAVWW